MEYSKTTSSRKTLLTNLEDVVGKIVERPISQGAALKKWHIREGGELRQGSAVSILAQKGCIQIEAPGKMLESGKPGDLIRVLNVATGREIYATVVDAKTVSVSF